MHSFENKKDEKINHAFKSWSYKKSNKTRENRKKLKRKEKEKSNEIENK